MGARLWFSYVEHDCSQFLWNTSLNIIFSSSRWNWNQNCGSRQQQLWVHLWVQWICCYIVARLDPLATDHSNIVLMLFTRYSLIPVPRWSPSWRTPCVRCLNLPHCSGHSVLHHITLWHCICHCLPCFQHYIQEQKVTIVCLKSVIDYWQIITLGIYCFAGSCSCQAPSWITWLLQELWYCTSLYSLLFIQTMQAICS